MDKQSWYARQIARLAYRRGCTLARQGNHQSAIAALSQALANHPDTASVYISRGLSYRALGQLDHARQDFVAAIDCAENPAVAYFHLGQLAQAQDMMADALRDWQQAIALNPSYTDAHYQLGVVQTQMNDLAAALASFDQVLERNPNRAEAYLKRGLVRHQLDDLEGAIADWQLATLNDPSLADQVPSVAKPDRLAPIKDLLQAELQPIDVSVKQQGKTLEISLKRQVGEGISYFTLPDQVCDLLLPLELSEITQFTLIGYVGNVRGPEWEKRYDLYKNQPCPPSHWSTALAALITFPPVGVTALLYASQVKRFYRRGQYPDARRASKAVRQLSLVGTGAMCLLASLPLGYTAIKSIQNEPVPPVRTARSIDYDVIQ
ncbi:tetratricopeptide tpr-1 repeat-containing protein [Leptolyngbya sp. Heron Island J]|uniref:tetratricopeptide repeat protein n=1 Tax=Leptolyngbya sp. Heron Island J TaxID=1385935 RepID=UPI0003B99359|nr:tetratricopeptide repeat protein [Leptolyngbya sp. Heron Island J]ESA32143.1 tetratricopeptide tpr-1 repeat-containing protein [Leptolyngbya sp. Heron Island J]